MDLVYGSDTSNLSFSLPVWPGGSCHRRFVELSYATRGRALSHSPKEMGPGGGVLNFASPAIVHFSWFQSSIDMFNGYITYIWGLLPRLRLRTKRVHSLPGPTGSVSTTWPNRSSRSEAGQAMASRSTNYMPSTGKTIRLLGLKKIKMGENLFERPAYEDLPLRPSGLVCFAIVLRSSVKRSFTQLWASSNVPVQVVCHISTIV